MRFHFTLPQKIAALVIVPLALSLSVLVLLTVFLDSANLEAEREAHSKEVSQEGLVLSHYMDNTIIALAAYSNGKDEQFLKVVSDAYPHLRTELVRLEQLVQENDKQQQIASTLMFFYDRLGKAIERAKKDPSEASLRHLWQVVREMKIELRMLNVYESRSTTSTISRQIKNGQKIEQIILIGAIFDLVAAGILVRFLVRPLVSRLLVLKDNNQRLARQQELLLPVGGNDEIAEIDRGFHDMAKALAEYVRKEQAMFENARDIICSLDERKTFLKINQACFDSLGYTTSEIAGHSLLNFLVDPNAAESIDKLLDEKSNGAFELSLTRKDGSAATFLWSAHWSTLDSALFCVLHDITERKRLERLKAGFLAMVSHDLRSPLTSILGMLSSLKAGFHGDLSEKALASVRRAERNAHGLIGLINELIDIERIESGQISLVLEPTPLTVLIGRAVDLLSDLAAQKSITIESTSEADIVAELDAEHIMRVLTNVLGNAIKFSPDNGLVSITCHRLDSSIEVRVTDQGRGVPKSAQTVIFDRFKQVELSDSRELNGTGLGLAISKLMIEAHGGSIGVDSEEGQGSTFWFRIPNQQPGANC